MNSRRPEPYGIGIDHLSALLEHFPLTAGVFHTGPLCGGYAFERRTKPGHFHFLRQGCMELIQPERPARSITVPSVVFMPNADSHHLVASPGAEMLCATVRFGSGNSNPVVGVLPALLIAPLDAAPGLAALSHLIFDEAVSWRAGRQASLNRLCELAVIAVLNQCLQQQPVGGALAGLADAQLSKALAAMHREPARDWSLGELAALAGMSRARFAVRFRAVVGATAGESLAAHRVAQAQSLLREGMPMKQVATRVGYGSASALARAFMRVAGCSPSDWRETR